MMYNRDNPIYSCECAKCEHYARWAAKPENLIIMEECDKAGISTDKFYGRNVRSEATKTARWGAVRRLHQDFGMTAFQISKVVLMDNSAVRYAIDKMMLTPHD